MNPFLSWTIFAVLFGAGYVGLYGLPQFLSAGNKTLHSGPVAKGNERKRTTKPTKPESSTKEKLKSHGDKINGHVELSKKAASMQSNGTIKQTPNGPTKTNAVTSIGSNGLTKKAHESNGASVKATGSDRSQKTQVESTRGAETNGSSKTTNELKHKKAQKLQSEEPQIATWYKPDASEPETKSNPVVDVMNGFSDVKTTTDDRRQREISKPIGSTSRKVASSSYSVLADYDHSDHVPENESEDFPHLAEAAWQKKQVKHVTDDMLEPSTNFVARTLKIVGESQPIKQIVRKVEESGPSKKQRQNAAKKAKAKAEKLELEEQQAAAFRSHQKSLEARRLAEITNVKKPKPVSDDWTTVSKAKVKAVASVDEGGKLIWD